MKIIRLEAANIKRLTAVTIEPSGAVVEIAGNNGAGKTSVLDAIWWALGGKRVIQSKPVRKGASGGYVILDIGDDGLQLKVTRRFSEDGEPTLRVEDASGARLKEPQAVLDAMIGAMTLDPVAFQRMKPAERVGVLKRLVPDFDFDKAAVERSQLFDKRTEVNRDAKRYRAQFEGIAPAPADTPDEEVDTDALARIISEAADLRAEFERLKGQRARLDERADELVAQAVEWENKAMAARMEAEKIRKTLDSAEDLEPPPDISATRAALEKANAVNANVRAKRERMAIEEAMASAAKNADRLTAEIEALDERVRKAVETADLPVRGLALGEEDVLLGGVPFDQASDAEQLRASMAIAMAENPQLRVIRVRDGSLLDAKGFEVIQQVAEADDWQVWVESVNPHGPAAVIMVEGAVARKEAE